MSRLCGNGSRRLLRLAMASVTFPVGVAASAVPVTVVVAVTGALQRGAGPTSPARRPPKVRVMVAVSTTTMFATCSYRVLILTRCGQG